MRAFAFVLLFLSMAAPARPQALAEGPRKGITAATVFFLYHELGHALIARLRPPLKGREEDAADVLAVLMAQRLNPDAESRAILLAAAAGFAIMAGEDARTGPQPGFWQSHALDRARQQRILCLFYGTNPAARAIDATRAGLTGAGREGCQAAYARARARWGPVIGWLREGGNRRYWIRIRVIEAPATGPRKAVLAAARDELRRLNRILRPDLRLIVSFERCGEANAFFDPETRIITLCAELGDLIGG